MSRPYDVMLGAAAGAAGTATLNALTYVDMAVRGRPASSTPEDTVEKVASMMHAEIPGDEQTRANRLTGLGSLAGIAAGVTVGAALGLLRSTGWRPAVSVTAAMATAGAMLAGNGPMALLKITNPGSWSLADWISDVVPHLGYGAVTGFALSSMDGGRSRD